MATPTLQIPQDVIQPIITAEICRVVAESLGDRAQLLEKAIASVLNTKVDSEGKVSSYANNNSPTWIDWAIGDTLRKAAKEALIDALVPHKEMIKKKLIDEMSKKNSPIIKQLCDGMASSFCNTERLKYGITIKAE